MDTLNDAQVVNELRKLGKKDSTIDPMDEDDRKIFLKGLLSKPINNSPKFKSCEDGVNFIALLLLNNCFTMFIICLLSTCHFYLLYNLLAKS